jgi:lipoprotein-anchoring transpeptidase ErfK/SrfK
LPKIEGLGRLLSNLALLASVGTATASCNNAERSNSATPSAGHKNQITTRKVVPATGRLRSVVRVRLTPSQVQQSRNWGILPGYATSVLDIPVKLRHGEYVWAHDNQLAGPLSIWIDLRRQTISAFRGGDEIGTAVIVYGAPQMPSPTGRFTIVAKSRNYYSHSYGAAMPYAMFITHSGVAIHASPMSASHATHGCIGVPEVFAHDLFNAFSVGDAVTIVQSNESPAS